MNILVIGKGGREHAIIRSLRSSSRVETIYCFPGRDGFEVKKLIPSSTDLLKDKNQFLTQQMIPLMKEKKIHLVIIGPEQELFDGWADVFRSHGFLVFGPNQEASFLEGSKIFAKEFMKSSGIPTSKYFIVENTLQTMEKAQKFSSPYVLKADGLAGGKGVFICHDKEELKRNSKKLFEEKVFKKAGEKALLEEFQKGYELSIFIFTNGREYITLPIAKDYKKLNDEDLGPNTGGMGAVAPVDISSSLMDRIHQQILQPTMDQMKKQNLFYRGVLYIGLMIVEDRPFVLEYNVRFGDPECQVLLPLLDGDSAEIFYDISNGALPRLQFKNIYSCCVVLAEKDYPHHPKKGAVIESPLASKEDCYVLHAGTKKSESGSWIIDGGRVLNAVSLGSSYEMARRQAYQLVNQIQCPYLYCRTDIGQAKNSI